MQIYTCMKLYTVHTNKTFVLDVINRCPTLLCTLVYYTLKHYCRIMSKNSQPCAVCGQLVLHPDLCLNSIWSFIISAIYIYWKYYSFLLRILTLDAVVIVAFRHGRFIFPQTSPMIGVYCPRASASVTHRISFCGLINNPGTIRFQRCENSRISGPSPCVPGGLWDCFCAARWRGIRPTRWSLCLGFLTALLLRLHLSQTQEDSSVITETAGSISHNCSCHAFRRSCFAMCKYATKSTSSCLANNNKIELCYWNVTAFARYVCITI